MSVEKAKKYRPGAVGTLPKLHTDGMHISPAYIFYRHFAPMEQLFALT
jgi:hypothetical protein